MVDIASMVNEAFRANKQQLFPASTSQPGSSSDPTVTIPGPSHHMAATPSMVPSATITYRHFHFVNVNYEEVLKAADYFRIRKVFEVMVENSLSLEGLKNRVKVLVRKMLLHESWVNDERKAAIELDDIGDEMSTEMLRLQAQGHKFDSAETRSVRRKILLKVKKLSEEQEDLIKRASFYGLGTNNGDMLQCGTCKSLQPHHSINVVLTYECYCG